jgi:isoleucyl-tRNA synthetase
VERLAELLLDELNVKELNFVGAEAELVEYTVRPVWPVLGPKYGSLTPKICAALAAADAAEVARKVHAGQPVELTVDERVVTLAPDEVEVLATAKPGYAVAEGEGVVVGISTELTPELVREGLAREVIRRVQNMRKDAGFELNDRIVTRWEAEGELAEAITQFGDYIAQETLSADLSRGPAPEGAHAERFEVDGHVLSLAIKLA